MAQLDRLPRRWGRRLLGGPDSWRRITLTGIVGGVTLAFVAALIVGLIGGGGGSLDRKTPTAVAPAAGPVDGDAVDTAPPAEETPTLTPETELPTEPPPPPTEEPPIPTEPLPTEPPLEPTLTSAPEEPTPEPTVAEGGGAQP